MMDTIDSIGTNIDNINALSKNVPTIFTVPTIDVDIKGQIGEY